MPTGSGGLRRVGANLVDLERAALLGERASAEALKRIEFLAGLGGASQSKECAAKHVACVLTIRPNGDGAPGDRLRILEPSSVEMDLADRGETLGIGIGAAEEVGHDEFGQRFVS